MDGVRGPGEIFLLGPRGNGLSAGSISAFFESRFFRYRAGLWRVVGESVPIQPV